MLESSKSLEQRMWLTPNYRFPKGKENWNYRLGNMFSSKKSGNSLKTALDVK